MHKCSCTEEHIQLFSLEGGGRGSGDGECVAIFSSRATQCSGHLHSVDAILRSAGRLADFTFDRPDLILSNVFSRPAETSPAAHLSPASVHHV